MKNSLSIRLHFHRTASLPAGEGLEKLFKIMYDPRALRFAAPFFVLERFYIYRIYILA